MSFGVFKWVDLCINPSGTLPRSLCSDLIKFKSLPITNAPNSCPYSCMCIQVALVLRTMSGEEAEESLIAWNQLTKSASWSCPLDAVLYGGRKGRKRACIYKNNYTRQDLTGFKCALKINAWFDFELSIQIDIPWLKFKEFHLAYIKTKSQSCFVNSFSIYKILIY